MLASHLATCKFALIPCPNQCKKKNAINSIMKKDLDKHLKEDCPNRECECKCGEKVTHATIKVHEETCKKIKEECPKCGKFIQRQGVKRHVETSCKEAEVQCKYQKLGCDKMAKRKDMPVHEDDAVKPHLQMVLDKVMAMDKVITDGAASKKDKDEASTISSFDSGQK